MQKLTHHSPGRLWTWLIAGPLCTVMMGVGVQYLRPLPGSDAAGTVLWTWMVGWVLLALTHLSHHHWPAWAYGLAASAIGVGVELFQLTPIPAHLAQLWRFFALILGTTFAVGDLPWYLVGGATFAMMTLKLLPTPRNKTLHPHSYARVDKPASPRPWH